MDKYQLMIQALVVARHNMQIIHWEAKGPMFDTVHGVSEGYYYRISAYLDQFAEMCVSLDIKMPELSDMDFGEGGLTDIITAQDAYTQMKYILETVANGLKSLIDGENIFTRENLTRLDDILAELNGEINYKMKQRLK